MPEKNRPEFEFCETIDKTLAESSQNGSRGMVMNRRLHAALHLHLAAQRSAEAEVRVWSALPPLPPLPRRVIYGAPAHSFGGARRGAHRLIAERAHSWLRSV